MRGDNTYLVETIGDLTSDFSILKMCNENLDCVI